MMKLINKLGFGLLRFPRVGGEDADDDAPFDWDTIEEMVDRFLAHGGRYFDTCYTYLGGTSEEAVRRCISARYPRDAFEIADKIPGYKCETPDDARRYVDEMLERCSIDRFDVLMLHWLDPVHYEIAQRLDQFAVLREAKEQGIALRTGFSFHGTADLLERILVEHPEVDVVQIQLNYLDWENPSIESRACYEACVRHGKPIVVMEPVRGGTLAEVPPKAMELLEAEHPGWSPSDWALRFAQSFPEVEICLSGMSAVDQVEANCRPFEPLTERDRTVLADVGAIIESEHSIPCTRCGYCLPHCPLEIPIPKYFNMFNELDRYPETVWKIRPVYEELIARVPGPADCVACGTCASHCPQGIAIPDMLREVAERFDSEKASE